MVPWIQVYSNMISHPKTYKLANLLGIRSQQVKPNVIAGGMMVSLWLWAAQNATDGDLSGVTADCLAESAGWRGKPETFRQALVESGFTDQDDAGGLHLHDWLDYASLLMEQEDNRRAKTNERVKRYREKKKGDQAPTCNGYCNATVTGCNAPTLPNLTLPNQELPTYPVQEERKEKKKEPDVENSDPDGIGPDDFLWIAPGHGRLMGGD